MPPMLWPGDDVVRTMCDMCGERYDALVTGGADAAVAMDRVFDAFDGIFCGRACFDPRDRDFQSELLSIAKGDI